MQADRHVAVPGAHFPYRPDIDGLRAIAVSIVVLFHAFPSLVRGGFVGVDIFFVISGYLITKILFSDLEKNRFSFAGFYARRIKRIFPALLLVMGASLAFGWIALFPDEFKLLGKHIVGGAGFISNLFLWYEVGYFDVSADTKPLLHLWSLGIEEQFYIFWPILLVLAFKWKSNPIRMTLALLALSLLVNVALVHRFPSATFYSIASRAWELLAGALLAYLSLKKGSDQPAAPDSGSAGRRDVMSVAGLGFILLACSLVRVDKAFPGWWALLPTIGAALLIAAGPRAWVNRVVLSNRVAVWIGLISYPLYLWHWPLLAFARIIESGVPALKIRVVAVVAAVALAWLTYRLLELPLRGRPKNRATVATLSALMVAVAAAGGWVYRQEGLPLRASIVENASLQKALITVEDRANAAACKKRYGFATLWEYCLLARLDSAPTVALIGDSHAYHVVAGLTKYYSSKGENLLFLGTRIPFWGVAVGTDKYQQATKAMLDLALATDSIKTVILTTAAKLHTENADGELMVQQFRDTVRRYTQAGKKVIYIYDVPLLNFEPRACIKRAGVPSSQTRTDCSMARAEFDQKTKGHDAIVAAVLKEFSNVEVFATAPYLCDAQRCHAMLDGKLMYRDVSHLTYDGDLYMGSKFAQEQEARRASKP